MARHDRRVDHSLYPSRDSRFREDDQLFLAPGEKELERQQVRLSQRMNRLTGRIRYLAFVSLAMFVLMVAVGAWSTIGGMR